MNLNFITIITILPFDFDARWTVAKSALNFLQESLLFVSIMIFMRFFQPPCAMHRMFIGKSKITFFTEFFSLFVDTLTFAILLLLRANQIINVFLMHP